MKMLSKRYIAKRNRSQKYFIFYIQSIILLLKIVISNNDSNEIYLVVKGTGVQPLLYNSFHTEPFQVLVNGNLRETCKKTCDLGGEEQSRITLKFLDQLSDCSQMFRDLTNIIEVDLSNFDAYYVETMESMFSGCSNLEKINFGRITTPSLKN